MIIRHSISWIGYPTVTRQERGAMRWLFFQLFTSTALILTFVNFQAQQPLLTYVLQGRMPTFDQNFWESTGVAIVLMQAVNAVVPVLSPLGAFAVSWLKRVVDRRGFDQRKTKRVSVRAYVELYSGPRLDYAC